MAFNQFMLEISDSQSRDIFNTYIYRSDTDTSIDIQATGYFAQSRFAQSDPDGWFSGKLEVKASDGYFEGFIQSDGTISPISDPVLTYAFLYKSGDAVELTNLTQNVPTKMIVTTVAKRLEGFTTDSAGGSTRSGPSFYAKVDSKMSGGNGLDNSNNRYEYRIAKNGTTIEAGKGEKTSTSTIDQCTYGTSDLLIEDGDVIEVYVENKSNNDRHYNTMFDVLITFERWA